ncbi:DOMON-like domain-containing protein [Brevundimonas sp. S30B]|uniref:DOMON-like domain-containing protein n=1 Tax=unclassified Brevundimonas TaxID=2622653 RepID=UPI0010727D8A|nr:MULTISPECIES: DOMON-like domain-containing protein [unclassified Brevundimonas]QBX37714.1 DOMON-like domain-containing protein [Brevundimonas sp. MF30-B]TFW00578.1 DOMON-like domain-containing protein [Brevundimonas sp. S30B]
MRLALIPHPSTAEVGGLTLEVEVRRAGRMLSLEYAVGGPVETVRWPQRAARVRTDGLWRTTCFEAFVGAGAGYAEANLSPSGAWALYKFDGYRDGMRAVEAPAPFTVVRQAPGRAVLTADVKLPPEATGPIGLCAVIERWDGAISYWALAHPSDKPDFHHPESFALELP